MPSVGRMVHYVSYGTPGGEFLPQCRAAVVSEVSPLSSTLVGLVVQNPTGLFFRSLETGGATLSEEKLGGTWHWPEYVAPEA